MKIVSAYYPQEKDEYWWIAVGDKKTNRVLTTKRTLLKNKSVVQIAFEKLPDC